MNNFPPSLLRELEHGRSLLVGHVTISVPFVRRETYECAAWFRNHELQPGRYEVRAVRHGRWTGDKHGDFVLNAIVPTRVVGACFVSLFGGCAIGPDTSGPREIGKASEYVLRVGSGHHFRRCLNPDAKSYYEAGEGRGEVYHESGKAYDVPGAQVEWLPAWTPFAEETTP